MIGAVDLKAVAGGLVARGPLASQQVAALSRQCGLSVSQRGSIGERAAELIEALRAPGNAPSVFEQMLSQFSLSTNEGLALMGLAEALLRVPDNATALALIRRQLASGDWVGSRVARTMAPKLAAWALSMSQGIAGSERADVNVLQRLSAPLVLRFARRAMRYVGDQFILGTTLEAALQHSYHAGGSLLSVDLLGEGARTLRDAEQYRDALFSAIHTLSAAPTPQDVDFKGPPALCHHALSIKISALEPRYEEAQRSRALSRLVPTLSSVFQAAAAARLAVTIDAEEQERLELSLDVLEAALATPALAGWSGAGLAVQAYGTRALGVIERVAALARSRGMPLHVRLVKGAYWDTEIKRAQERGLPEYPVFTDKAATDVSYMAAAHALFTHEKFLWPQFATHNPHTLCAVREIAGDRPYELQRLHGMGERLYRAAAVRFPTLPPVRVYAPIGDHRSLLAYLVRRLLENGANTSFLSQQDDPTVAASVLAADPLTLIQDATPSLPLPTALFAPERATARAWDLGRSETWRTLREWYACAEREPMRSTGPCVSAQWRAGESEIIRSPANGTAVIGRYRLAGTDDAREALEGASAARRSWARLSVNERAQCLERAAVGLENAAPELLPLLVREAGKSWPDAIAELREAVDFCRYYAARARELGVPRALPGPTGESNVLSWHPRGVFYCIAPWNFPLAIFVGQVTAALVAGNTVLAKPAPQTPFVAAAAVRILMEAGVPAAALQCLPGDGLAVSEVVLKDSRLAGVAFTGSTATAQRINKALAERDGPIIPFIAETGGINVMIVDSTALPEQAVDDIVTSAFRAAGQRCSALRLLCVQEDIADAMLTMLMGATDALVIGDPADPATDVGPLIDAAALARIEQYLAVLPRGARVVHRATPESLCPTGHFCAPTLIELKSVRDLKREIFGPILHVVRFPFSAWDELIEDIEASGFGLTMGIHSRLSTRAHDIFERSRIGNTYVNRNTVGAVVGVQPFGGEGLCGTGPKAGGPNYLLRFMVERVLTVNETAWGGNVDLLRSSPR
jgi:RHH-type proline utilization regulon transcriptional repressor/proline dehydrogenase/delta 1-pyrroline-5-carboxylate dehydrogenase